jgi:lysophospholipase L1-like esterase
MILRPLRLIAVLLLGSAANFTAAAQGDSQRAFDPATAAQRPSGTKIRVDLIGDSTQTRNAGYGRGFCANLTAQVDCLDMAKGGASTKTFRADGLWERALETQPDYMVIQFGHNDAEKVDGVAELPRQVSLATYEANLRAFVTEARAAGIKPVLVTPLTRRYFAADGKIHSDLGAQSAVVRKIAADMHVPLIDLQAESIALLDKVGEAEGNKLAITKKDSDGKTVFDKTHLNWAGSYVFGRIVAKDLGAVVPALHPYVRPEAAKLPPEGLKAMRILNGGPVKIVLVGDSTVALGGGWGPGFCKVMTPNVTCVDLALNGRSTKSFVEEGAWKKALAEKGDYYLIQFGHNDQKRNNPQVFADANTTYQDYLRQFIAEVRAQGGIPVLVTSLSRRTFRDGKVVEDLTAYVNAAKKVGAEDDCTVIDLNALSVALLNHMTQAQADEFDAVAHVDAAAENKATPALDRTHLNPHGQEVFGRIVADQLIRTEVELGPDVVGEPTGKSVVPTFLNP